MKHAEAQRLLVDLMTEAGISTTGAEATMVRHVEWLLETNTRLNLTAITSLEDALRLHVVDSLLASEPLQGAPAGRMLDLGTGGGFPGIPLGLAGGRQTVLLDSVAKKASAVDEFLRQERLDQFSVVALRAEEYAQQSPESCAAVVCRAVAPLASLLELASPLLREGGDFIALKAVLSDGERAHGDKVAEIVGLEPTNRWFLSLPRGGERREVLSFRKVRQPRISLPRRNGMAQKRPLAG